MSYLALNILIALTWSALWGEFSFDNLAAGLVLGYFGLWVIRKLGRKPSQGDAPYFWMLVRSVILFGYFIKELVKSCITVAKDCIARNPNLHPTIVKMPIGPKSDLEIFILANLITLTPGTLTLDVAEDKSYLLIHSIYGQDPEQLIRDLKEGMEYEVAKVFQV